MDISIGNGRVDFRIILRGNMRKKMAVTSTHFGSDKNLICFYYDKTEASK